jgi:hypothetical protein
MADLSDINSALNTKLIGADATGLETNPVNADVNGNLHVVGYSDGPVTPGAVAARSSLAGGQFNSSLPSLTNAQQTALQVDSNGRLIIRPLLSGTDSVAAVQSGTWTVQQGTPPWSVVGNVASGSADSGNPIKIGGVYNATLPVVSSGQRVDLQLDQNGRLLTSTAVTSSLPAASFSVQQSINTGITAYTQFTAATKLALKQFYAGGTGVGKQELYSYGSATNSFINAGDFESASNFGTSTDTNKWFWTSGGTGSIAQSNTQVFSGSFSAQLTFSNSSGGNAQSVKQNFTTPVDFSGWRYVSAEFFNTLSSGGAYTRTISIVLTDNATNTRTYSVSGSSTASPFNSSGWIQILGEIANPTSASGTSFDPTQIASVTLTMNDSANKSGVVYWDTVKLSGSLTPIFPIYHVANTSFNIAIDPVFVMNIGDTIIIAQTNNDTVRREYFASANGVSI